MMDHRKTALKILAGEPVINLVDDIRGLAADYIRVLDLLASANQVLQFTEPELNRLRKELQDIKERAVFIED
jgi:hypothetical protein